MAERNVKVCILRARHEPTGPTISEQACLEMLMIGGGSVDRCHRRVFGLHRQCAPAMVDISIGPAEPREKAAEKAFQATKDAGGSGS